MLGLFFLLLLATTVTFVLANGGREERVVIGALIAAAVVTAANYVWLSPAFDRVQPVLVVTESLVLILCLRIAFRSARYWPLVVASLQLATVLSLLTPLFGTALVSRPLGVMQGLWAYLQLAVLALAVLRQRRGPRPSTPERS